MTIQFLRPSSTSFLPYTTTCVINFPPWPLSHDAARRDSDKKQRLPVQGSPQVLPWPLLGLEQLQYLPYLPKGALRREYLPHLPQCALHRGAAVVLGPEQLQYLLHLPRGALHRGAAYLLHLPRGALHRGAAVAVL